jgi:hypothetical protein
MKQVFLLLAAGLLLSCGNADKQSAASPVNNDSTSRSTLNDAARFTELQWVDSTDQDLGNVTEGQTVDIIWRVKNTGTNPLVIADVTPGCGCTVADKPNEPIAPGGEGKIRATFDSKNQAPGTHTKTVTVRANTSQQAYYLNFKVNVVK